jgi:hypothetical protein
MMAVADTPEESSWGLNQRPSIGGMPRSGRMPSETPNAHTCSGSARPGDANRRVLINANVLESLAGAGWAIAGLFPGYGDFGGWDLEAHESMVGIEIENHFEIGGRDAKRIVRLAATAGRA